MRLSRSRTFSHGSTLPGFSTSPIFAGPDEPAILLGTQLPPCMQARYSSAIFFRPPNVVAMGNLAAPWMFWAQVKSPVATHETVDEGYLVYDGALPGAGTVCAFVVVKEWEYNNLLGAAIQGLTTHGLIAVGGSGGPTTGTTIEQFGPGCSVQIGINKPSDTPWTVDGTSAERGRRMWVASQNPTGAIGAETAIMTGTPLNIYNNRAYRFEVDAAYFGSVANVALLRWRDGVGTGGTLLALAQHPCAGGGAGSEHRFHDEFVLIRTAGSDLISEQITVTLQSSAGTVTQQGTATQVRSFKISDCGDAADFNAANTI